MDDVKCSLDQELKQLKLKSSIGSTWANKGWNNHTLSKIKGMAEVFARKHFYWIWPKFCSTDQGQIGNT